MKLKYIIIIAIIALIAIVGIMGYAQYVSQQANVQQKGTETQQVQQNEQQQIQQAQQPETPAKETEKQQQIDEQTAVFNEEFTFTDFPAVKTSYFDAGRYRVTFETDYTIRFVMYSEQRYNEWKSSGTNKISKVNPL